MKKLIVLMIVSALCAPSFGAILVYKQSSSLKGFIFDINEFTKGVDVLTPDPNDPNQAPPLFVDTTTLNSAQDASAKLIGYVVMDVNVDTLLINDNDINDNNALKPYNIAAEADGAAIIIVDKKLKTYQVIRDTQPVSTADINVFRSTQDANFGTMESAEMHKAEVVLNKKGTATKKTLVVVDLDGSILLSKNTNLDDLNINKTGDKDEYRNEFIEFGTMVGALKNTDIDGSKTKVLVPTSLKGHGGKFTEVGTSIETDQQFSSTDVEIDSNVHVDTELNGTATLKLDKKLTQTANTSTPTTKGTVAALVAALEADGFTKVLPLAVPFFD